MNAAFQLVGIRPAQPEPPVKKPRRCEGKPIVSMALLGAILLACLFSGLITGKDPAYLDLMNCGVPPSRAFLFGTDTLGRDIFSMIWNGGRLSLFIGFAATVISTAIAVVFGAASGCAPVWLDALMMRLAELLLSVPSLLAIVMIQAILGKPGVLSLSVTIGLTSWMSIAKVVRTQVRQIRGSGYVAAARCMGGGFFHVLRRHLAPNFVSSILFMVVMNIRSAIVAESTLSFMGLGLPIGVISWGSMLSLAEKALLTGAWWIVLIPGMFLVVTLVCITNLGNSLRRNINRGQSSL